MNTLDRILGSMPDYYGPSKVMRGIQATKAAEYDRIAARQADLKLQLHPSTATWGLKYYEEALGIITNEADSYDVRRSRVIAKRRSPGNFSAQLLKNVAEAFSNGEVDVDINFTTGQITVTFVGARGIPPNLDDLKEQIENIVHAHLGVDYAFTYLTWDETDAKGLTWDETDALNLTWDEWDQMK